MLTHFPVSPLPDEYLLGWRGRLKFLNHYPSIKILEDDLRCQFYDKDDGRGFGIPENSPIVFLFAIAAGMNVSDFVQKHSLVPFSRAFDLKKFGSEEWGDSAVTFLKYRGVSPLKKGAWFCRDCLKEDLVEYGTSYWRRGHQLPAVHWCLKHDSSLSCVTSVLPFDKPPPIKDMQEGNIYLSNFRLSQMDEVIQRYVQIADFILNKLCISDFYLVTHILEERGRELELLGQNGRNLILEDEIKARLPEEWLACFKREKEVFGVSRVFAKISSQRATELYLLLFAFFYDSLSEVMIEFEIVDHMATLFQLGGKDYSYELLYGEYIRKNGKVADVKGSCSLSHEAVSEYLSLNGLPDLDGEHESDLMALNDFFSGWSLSSVCEMHGANIGSIERLLRKSGARLARAMNRMNTAKTDE